MTAGGVGVGWRLRMYLIRKTEDLWWKLLADVRAQERERLIAGHEADVDQRRGGKVGVGIVSDRAESLDSYASLLICLAGERIRLKCIQQLCKWPSHQFLFRGLLLHWQPRRAAIQADPALHHRLLCFLGDLLCQPLLHAHRIACLKAGRLALHLFEEDPILNSQQERAPLMLHRVATIHQQRELIHAHRPRSRYQLLPYVFKRDLQGDRGGCLEHTPRVRGAIAATRQPQHHILRVQPHLHPALVGGLPGVALLGFQYCESLHVRVVETHQTALQKRWPPCVGSAPLCLRLQRNIPHRILGCNNRRGSRGGS
mmetsp:Transcript_4427/g.8042  ORF Transcript_4427/g.8042 Transcript_4427/m.8042 type:complete len:313 (+) Transcript_4427:1458-2396(+)